MFADGLAAVGANDRGVHILPLAIGADDDSAHEHGEQSLHASGESERRGRGNDWVSGLFRGCFAGGSRHFRRGCGGATARRLFPRGRPRRSALGTADSVCWAYLTALGALVVSFRVRSKTEGAELLLFLDLLPAFPALLRLPFALDGVDIAELREEVFDEEDYGAEEVSLLLIHLPHVFLVLLSAEECPDDEDRDTHPRERVVEGCCGVEDLVEDGDGDGPLDVDVLVEVLHDEVADMRAHSEVHHRECEDEAEKLRPRDDERHSSGNPSHAHEVDQLGPPRDRGPVDVLHELAQLADHFRPEPVNAFGLGQDQVPDHPGGEEVERIREIEAVVPENVPDDSSHFLDLVENPPERVP